MSNKSTSKTVAASGVALTRAVIRRALGQIDNPMALASNPLCALRVVARYLADFAAIGAAESAPRDRGRALQQVLKDALNGLRPHAGELDLADPAWRWHTALHMQFVQGRNYNYVAQQLGMSTAAFYRLAAEAIDMLIDAIFELDRADAALSTRAAVPGQASVATPGEAAFEWTSVLPLLRTGRFVGRSFELKALHMTLCADAPGSAIRMTGVVGMPGVGKTELLKQFVHDSDVTSHFGGGILWAALGRDPDVTLQLQTWARALGIENERILSMRTTLDLARMLHGALADRRILFVLDDVWTAGDALALQIGGPHSAIVFATRFPEVAAGLAGKSVLRLEVLPDDDGLDLLATFAPDVLFRHAEVCRNLAVQLGGLPLALVLAGQYLREAAFTGQPRRVRDALGRLQESLFRFSLADKSAVLDGAQPAQRSLSVVLNETLDALSPEAQRALPGLGTLVHKPHTFSEDTLLAVCQASTAVCDELVNFGVIEVANDDRYAMHQTLADYLRSRFSQREDWMRMIGHYADAIERDSSDLERVKAEFDTLLAATQRARRNGHAVDLVRLTLGLHAYLDAHGLWLLAATLLGACLDTTHVQERPVLHLTLMQKQAMLLLRLNRVSEASALGWRLMRMAGETHDLRGVALAYDFLAQVALARDDAAGAAVLGRHAMELALGQGDRQLTRMTRGTLAVCLAACGEVAESELVVQEDDLWSWPVGERRAEKFSRQAREHVFRTRTVLASTQLLAGHFAQAEDTVRSALLLAESLEQTHWVIQTQALIAWIMHFRGRLTEAQDLVRGLLDEYDAADACAAVHHVLGCVAWCRGDFAAAETHFATALQRDEAAATSSLVSRATMLAMLGRARASQGNFTTARAALNDSLAQCQLRVERIQPLVELAAVAARQERLDEALGHVREAQQLRELLGLFDGPYFASLVDARSGEIRLLAGDARGAHGDYTRAHAHAQRMGAPELIGVAEFGLAQALAAHKNVSEASALARRACERLNAIGHHKARLAHDFDVYLGARPGVKQPRNALGPDVPRE